MRKIWDISQPVKEGIPVWPGDEPYSAKRNWEINDSCPVNVGSISLSVHTGTHTDAPIHFDNSGQAIDEVDLSTYIGDCFVIDMTNPIISHHQPLIKAEQIIDRLPETVSRVLFKTYKQVPLMRWDQQFTAIAVDTIDLLAKRGARLIGIDTPSVDPADSKTLEAHHRIQHYNIRILEGLLLDNITEGAYELIALPLKLVGMDASPVRAILRSVDKTEV